VIIGNNVAFNINSFYNGHGGIKIGDGCLFGPGVKVISANHVFSGSKLIQDLGHEGKQVNIGHNVWVGANVVILPGVSIGDNCVIGAGSIVTKNIPPNKIVAGNPAKIIKENYDSIKDYL